mmetsp:Transcript_52691/g.78445  ORF Transcript_52691/g.78445 Transcript_52691/m.78445 type:complete len:219 (+) Transcript_52691:1083-1739(+)
MLRVGGVLLHQGLQTRRNVPGTGQAVSNVSHSARDLTGGAAVRDECGVGVHLTVMTVFKNGGGMPEHHVPQVMHQIQRWISQEAQSIQGTRTDLLVVVERFFVASCSKRIVPRIVKNILAFRVDEVMEEGVFAVRFFLSIKHLFFHDVLHFLCQISCIGGIKVVSFAKEETTHGGRLGEGDVGKEEAQHGETRRCYQHLALFRFRHFYLFFSQTVPSS